MDRFDRIYQSKRTLDEQLTQYSEQLKIDLPAVFEAYEKMVDRLEKAEAGQGAPKIGEKLPDFLLPNHQGRLISSKDLLNQGPLVVSFNRGYWCSYCRFELLALAEIHTEIKRKGGEIVSIMPERAASLRQTIEKNDLTFPILSDIDNGYALECGLMVSLGQDIKNLFSEIGTDLEKVQGNDGWFVPIPANFIVDKDGTIIKRHVDADFKHRMASLKILKFFS